MKKTFLAKRNALLSGRGVSSGVVALGVVLLILGFRLVAPNLFLHIVTPIFQFGDTLSADSHLFLSHFTTAATLTEANDRLASENATLASENRTLTKEIADITALLGASNTPKEIPGLIAGVVVRPPVSPYDTLVLALGAKEGVTPNMEVFGPGDVPVGFISSVQNDFSRATLFSAPGTSVSGWVGSTSAPLTLTGIGAGAFQAVVPRVANIVVGDVVFVPGPGMKAIGTVARVDSDPLSPGVTLRIMPAVSPFSLSWVMLRATGAAPAVVATSTVP